MRVIEIVKIGLQEAWTRRRLVTLLYIFQLLLAITIGLQVYQVIEASIGSSVSVEKLIYRFDYTVIQDLINTHGASISPLLGQMRWFVLAYLVYSAFLQGGALYVILLKKDNWLSFWEGGAKCFGRFMAYGLFFMTIAILWTVLLWLPYLSNFFNLIETWTTEKPIIWLLILIVVCYFNGLAFLFSWSLLSRIEYIKNGASFLKSVKSGFQKLISQFRSILMICVAYAFIIALFYCLNFFLEWTIGIHNEWLIIGFFVVQQLVIWSKIALRVAIYASFGNINKQIV